MSLAAIKKTIRVMCSEVRLLDNDVPNWRRLTEEALMCEAVICMFGSQMVFEVAVAAAERVKSAGLLRRRNMIAETTDYETSVAAALSKPLTVEINGVQRCMLPRFRNRLAMLLASSAQRIYGQGSSLREILRSALSATDARKKLVIAVSGFGPKQASLFLRRIGYCSDLAVLDTHVLDYLRLAYGVDPKPGSLSRLQAYESVEREFRRVAEEFGHGVGCVDLAMWVTMRVAKREAVI